LSARIGLPNEHLAKSFVDVANPSFSTGVGLVLKGFEEYEADEMISNKNNKIETVVVDDKTDVVPPKPNKPGIFRGFGSILSNFLKDGEEFEDYSNKNQH
jgi:hypothetical protein